ncbi:MAG: CHAT domain-containing protein, partial [Pseudomonadota bacterium]|nr:CHAT domain-containing protein [Pseudomonadota bacterium]
MRFPFGDKVTPEIVDYLLSLPTLEQQVSFLLAAGLLEEHGLNRLLDVADELVNSDPSKAQNLIKRCAEMADKAHAPAVVPRADYAQAQIHGIHGEFDAYLRLTEAAHDGYVALGMNLEALRTNVGKMAALLELGRYQETLETGQFVLNTLGGNGAFEVEPTQRQVDLLTALVHHNRGGCLEYMGRYEEALHAYAVAEKRYRALGMIESIGEVSTNRGAIFLYLGKGDEALAAHEAAAAIFEKAGLSFTYAKALANIGQAHLQLGNYKRSLDAFEQTRPILESLDARADKYLLLRDTADAYLSLNLYSEALATYREADGLLSEAGMTHDRALVLWGAGSALIAHSQFEQAEETLDEAATLFNEAGNAPLLSGVMLERASLLAARGEQATALATAYGALDLVSGNDWPVQLLYAHLRLADLLLPNVTAVEQHLQEARRLADRLALPQLHYRLNERLGRLRLLQGRDDEAQDLLETAIDELERLRGTVTQDAMRASFLRDKTATYEDLLQLYLAREDRENVWRAFAVAERAKSRALVDLLAGVSEEGPKTSADSELGDRLQGLQADLNAVYNRLLGANGRDDGTSHSDLQARATDLEQEISRLRLQVEVVSEVRDPFADPLALEDIREQVPQDVTLLAYHVIGDEVMAFIGSQAHIRVVRHLGSVTQVQQLLHKLNAQWYRFCAGSEFAGRNMRLLERSTQRILVELYRQLVEPVENILDEVTDASADDTGAARKLAIVPHGPLHQVPFQALFDGRLYLLERFEISYAPSARVYALCQDRASRSLENALVMSVADPLIPAVTGEAHAVARHFTDAELRKDERATLSALHTRAQDRSVLHLACHGLFRTDNPMFSALKLHDGWLTAADAMRLNLKAALVTLSACESGRAG